MKSRKAAQGMDIVTKLVIFMIVTVSFVLLTQRVGWTIEREAQKDRCYAAMVKASTIGALTRSPDIDCPMDDDVVLEGEARESNIEILGMVTDTIFVCGEGNLKLPKDYWLAGKLKSSCVIYKIFKFSPEGQENYAGQTLQEAIEQEEMPIKKISYFDYFSTLMQNKDLIININDGKPIDPAKTYAVYIGRYSEDYEILGMTLDDVKSTLCPNCKASGSFDAKKIEDEKKVAVELIPYNQVVPDRCQKILN